MNDLPFTLIRSVYLESFGGNVALVVVALFVCASVVFFVFFYFFSGV